MPSVEKCFSILHQLRDPAWLDRCNFDLSDLNRHFFSVLLRVRKMMALQKMTDCLMFLGELQRTLRCRAVGFLCLSACSQTFEPLTLPLPPRVYVCWV